MSDTHQGGNKPKREVKQFQIRPSTPTKYLQHKSEQSIENNTLSKRNSGIEQNINIIIERNAGSCNDLTQQQQQLQQQKQQNGARFKIKSINSFKYESNNNNNSNSNSNNNLDERPSSVEQKHKISNNNIQDQTNLQQQLGNNKVKAPFTQKQLLSVQSPITSRKIFNAGLIKSKEKNSDSIRDSYGKNKNNIGFDELSRQNLQKQTKEFSYQNSVKRDNRNKKMMEEAFQNPLIDQQLSQQQNSNNKQQCVKVLSRRSSPNNQQAENSESSDYQQNKNSQNSQNSLKMRRFPTNSSTSTTIRNTTTNNNNNNSINQHNFSPQNRGINSLDSSQQSMDSSGKKPPTSAAMIQKNIKNSNSKQLESQNYYSYNNQSQNKTLYASKSEQQNQPLNKLKRPSRSPPKRGSAQILGNQNQNNKNNIISSIENNQQNQMVVGQNLKNIRNLKNNNSNEKVLARQASNGLLQQQKQQQQQLQNKNRAQEKIKCKKKLRLKKELVEKNNKNNQLLLLDQDELKQQQQQQQQINLLQQNDDDNYQNQFNIQRENSCNSVNSMGSQFDCTSSCSCSQNGENFQKQDQILEQNQYNNNNSQDNQNKNNGNNGKNVNSFDIENNQKSNDNEKNEIQRQDSNVSNKSNNYKQKYLQNIYNQDIHLPENYEQPGITVFEKMQQPEILDLKQESVIKQQQMQQQQLSIQEQSNIKYCNNVNSDEIQNLIKQQLQLNQQNSAQNNNNKDQQQQNNNNINLDQQNGIYSQITIASQHFDESGNKIQDQLEIQQQQLNNPQNQQKQINQMQNDVYYMVKDKNNIQTQEEEEQEFSEEKKWKGNLIKWKMGDPLGSGSYGTVFRALNQETGEIFAVKRILIPKDTSNNDIEKEIINMEKCNHKNVIKYYGHEKLSQDDMYMYIYMEYMDLGSLADILKSQKDKPLDEELIRNYSKQILEALEYLHSQHIIHKDIKSGNILVDKNGQAKLSDFGNSKFLEESLNSYKTVNQQVGSIPWMPPEFVKNVKYSKNADIWSFGCTIVEMLTCKIPWSELGEIGFMGYYKKIVLGDDLPYIPEFASEDLKDFILKCLKKDKNERASAVQLLQHTFITKYKD